MSKKFLMATIIIIMVGMLWLGVSGNKSENLINPQIPSSSEIPSPIPTPTVPKTFKFDNSTDLKMELEKIDPQVLDTDFE